MRCLKCYVSFIRGLPDVIVCRSSMFAHLRSEWPLLNGATEVRAVWEGGSGLAAESTALTRGPDFLW